MTLSAGMGACAAVLSLAAVCASHAQPRTGATVKTHVVTVENMKFSPRSLTVQRGERIVWVNKDLFPHTATADSKAFDSHEIAPRGSWAYVADKSGEYAYSCIYHPTMKARIVVH